VEHGHQREGPPHAERVAVVVAGGPDRPHRGALRSESARVRRRDGVAHPGIEIRERRVQDNVPRERAERVDEVSEGGNPAWASSAVEGKNRPWSAGR
jgi:hypothetical protein